ncbi:MAG: hypothetical protein PHD74_07100, partial [Candidatus Krumholzibacteria bacterium]|nr:hypothetical protein [Candidatus Krumholzibacteria bacterium]
MLPYKDFFGVDDETTKRIFSCALARGGSYCDSSFQHTRFNQITMEEGIVRQGEKAIAHGA